MNTYYPMIKDTLEMFFFLGFELSVLFILISAGVSLVQQYVPDSKIKAALSGRKGLGYIFAALFGALTPFCSCSTIPVLRGLLKAEVGFGPTLAFLFTSPLLNPIIIGLFLATFGIRVTVVYTSVALAVSIIAGLVLQNIGFERYVIPEVEGPVASCCTPNQPTSSPAAPSMASCCTSSPTSSISSFPSPITLSTACCASTPGPIQASSCCASPAQTAAPTFTLKIQRAFQNAWLQFKAILPYLLLGIALGSVVYGFVPTEFIAKYASGDSLLAVPIAAVIGIPLYVRAEALIPLSAVLAAKGMGLGAIMALIIGGAGASLTEVILLKSMFHTPMIAAFLTVILGMAVSAGYLFQYVL
jgi:uncharacterized protein